MNIVDYLTMAIMNVPYFAVAMGLLLAGKIVYDKTTTYSIDEQLTEKDNTAFGVCMAGYMGGLALAIGGSMYGMTDNPVGNFFSITVCGAISIVLMRVSVEINDRLILNRFSINKEMIEDRNVGTGFVVAGSCIANGLILMGVMTGNSHSFLGALLDITVFWTLGQLFLVVGTKVFQFITPYDAHEIIEREDNLPVGLSLGGFLVANGLLVSGALRGAAAGEGGATFGKELSLSLSTWVVGLVLLVATRIIADKVFLPKANMADELVKDKNPAAGAIACVSYICVAVFLSSTLGH